MVFFSPSGLKIVPGIHHISSRPICSLTCSLSEWPTMHCPNARTSTPWVSM